MMADTTAQLQEDAARVIEGTVEHVFASVDAVRTLMLECYLSATARGERLNDADVRALAPAIRRLLDQPDQIAVGLGVILEPGLLASHPLRIEWWQWSGARDQLVPLEVDLHPNSLGFYDYAATDWFAVPRRTRRRHVVGPYVDVHGTDRYLLTLTVPVETDGTFLGVAGADVPISRFESLVLRQLGPVGDTVVFNAERRVVLSTSSRWITGSLLPESICSRARVMPQLPWRLVEPEA
jgi:hypothetical protein